MALARFQRALVVGKAAYRFGSIRTLAKMISEGDQFPPNASVMLLADGKHKEVPISKILSDKKVVLVGVPGAFTPTCNEQHIPEYVKKFADFEAKGVDAIAVLAVNDPFVLRSWAESLDAVDKLTMLGDGNGKLVSELGVAFTTGKFGGTRSRRFSMLIENGKIKKLHLENGGAYTDASSASKILGEL